MTTRLSRAVLVAGLAVLALLAGLPSAPAASASRDAGSDGPYAVGVRTETFVDPTRPTAVNGTAAARPDRTLVTTVFYPAEGEAGGADVVDAPALDRRFPLVVFAHGFIATGPAYTFLLRQLAAEGYVVAAPTFPLSNGGAAGGPNLGDYVNQPADVSFVIDEMLRLDRQRGGWLRRGLRRTRIGVAGHSLGGVTTLGFLNGCCRDHRVDALIPMSAIRLPFGDGSYEPARRIPVLLIHGDADGTVPYGGSTTAYADARRPKFLLTLLGAGHVPFGGPAGEVLVESTVDFLDRYVARSRPALDDLIGDGARPGVSTLQAEVR
ncbi:MAG: alpha/beta hydrolase [Acidimicrobiia bacterium]|nr:alpha/beta hydrolase [Acidimicrobiia bacterium]